MTKWLRGYTRQKRLGTTDLVHGLNPDDCVVENCKTNLKANISEAE